MALHSEILSDSSLHSADTLAVPPNLIVPCLPKLGRVLRPTYGTFSSPKCMSDSAQPLSCYQTVLSYGVAPFMCLLSPANLHRSGLIVLAKAWLAPWGCFPRSACMLEKEPSHITPHNLFVHHLGFLRPFLFKSAVDWVTCRLTWHAKSTMFGAPILRVLRGLVCVLQLVSWYDNEWGYSHRVVDLIRHMALVGAK